MGGMRSVPQTMLLVPTQINPRHSMYGIFTYIGVVWGVNVGIYGIHGVSGNCSRDGA